MTDVNAPALPRIGLQARPVCARPSRVPALAILARARGECDRDHMALVARRQRLGGPEVLTTAGFPSA